MSVRQWFTDALLYKSDKSLSFLLVFLLLLLPFSLLLLLVPRLVCSLVSQKRIDLLVANQLILELKCVDALAPIHQAQLMTYMKLAKVKTGMFINFNVPLLKNGLKRIVL